MKLRRLSLALFLGLAAAAGATGQAFPQARDVVVFAAASLKNALDDAGAAWTRETGKKAVISYGASSALARQLESGAPADIFISADTDWMNYAAGKNLIKPGSAQNLLGNRIVLVAPASSRAELTLAPGAALAPLLGADGRLSMANVDSVPAGKYGKAALAGLGLWDQVSGRIVEAMDVRAALNFVARGEAPLGIVYQTDAAAEPKVKIVAAFPANTHPPIIYPVALTASSTNADAAAFLAFLRSPAARPFFEKQGFSVITPHS